MNSSLFTVSTLEQLKMESGSNNKEPASRDELCNINLVPSDLFLKFWKEIEGIRVGLNL
uniref:DUF7781 domain-containing protein n=1 Tax=Nelumbo nucifera TaxID=4432 RepID=A0A822ZLQ5_NELNU|nr:TPA_asm: hypothetical protein HUJ06_016931 [Nelumbo nucifera]